MCYCVGSFKNKRICLLNSSSCVLSCVLSFHFQMSKTLESSPNALINKKVLDRYLTLELPENLIQATYIWIDGTDENIRCKDRTLDFIPKSVKGKHLHFQLDSIWFNLFCFILCGMITLCVDIDLLIFSDLNRKKSVIQVFDMNQIDWHEHAMYCTCKNSHLVK